MNQSLLIDPALLATSVSTLAQRVVSETIRLLEIERDQGSRGSVNFVAPAWQKKMSPS